MRGNGAGTINMSCLVCVICAWMYITYTMMYHAFYIIPHALLYIALWVLAMNYRAELCQCLDYVEFLGLTDRKNVNLVIHMIIIGGLYS